MARILLIGASLELANSLRQSFGSAPVRLETTGWANWPAYDVRRGRPDAALFDMTAPGALGLQQIADRHTRHRRLRLIFLVDGDLVRTEEFQRLLESPMVDFVRAPVDANEVWHRVRRLVAAAAAPTQAPRGAIDPERRLEIRRGKVGPAMTMHVRAHRATREDLARAPAGLASGLAFRHLVPAIHDPDSGRLDAKKISALFGMTLADIARLLGRDLSAVHKTPAAPSLQPRLALFERVGAPLLYLAGSPENLRVWLNAPNPDLEGEAPLALLKNGEGEVVAELLEDTLVGQPG